MDFIISLVKMYIDMHRKNKLYSKILISITSRWYAYRILYSFFSIIIFCNYYSLFVIKLSKTLLLLLFIFIH